jgi:hypothetical protein
MTAWLGLLRGEQDTQLGALDYCRLAGPIWYDIIAIKMRGAALEKRRWR